MSDVIVAILHFPNDPTNNNVAHQMYVAVQNASELDLYSISSILGKEKRVYGADKDDYVTILSPEDSANGFKVPSFIDCTKMYRVVITPTMNLAALAQRTISPQLKQRIETKIAQKKAEGRHTIYQISESDFRSWNSRI